MSHSVECFLETAEKVVLSAVVFGGLFYSGGVVV